MARRGASKQSFYISYHLKQVPIILPLRACSHGGRYCQAADHKKLVR